jgi:hypothetical protein
MIKKDCYITQEFFANDQVVVQKKKILKEKKKAEDKQKSKLEFR